MFFRRNNIIAIADLKAWIRRPKSLGIVCVAAIAFTTLPATPSAQNITSKQTFDPFFVDRVLYPHQSVGVPYTISGKRYYPLHDPGYNRAGVASWYGDKFHGKLTANGEVYNKHAMTAAHRTLPLNSYVIVTNLETRIALKLRINDRGPFAGNRIIDLSEAAAVRLGLKKSGLGLVSVQYAGPAPIVRTPRRHKSPLPAPRIKPVHNPQAVNP